jgi:hypothetical protein
MLVKTSELTGGALDWAVAKCEGATDFGTDGITHSFKIDGQLKVLLLLRHPALSWHPSTDWAHAGAIIERERIETCSYSNDGVETAYRRNEHGFTEEYVVPVTEVIVWTAWVKYGSYKQNGPTPLIAALRCYVASKLGDEIEIPDALDPAQTQSDTESSATRPRQSAG